MGAYDFLMGAQGVQLPDPMKLAAGAMSLSQLANTNALSQYQLESARRKDAAAQGVGNALGGLDMNDDAAVMRALQSAPPEARADILKTVQDARKSQAETKFKQAEAGKQDWEVQAGKAKLVGGLAYYLANKPDVNERDVAAAVQNLKSFGVDPSTILPPPGVDPRAHWSATAAQAMDAIKQLEAGQTERRDTAAITHHNNEDEVAVRRLAEDQRNHNLVDARTRDSNAQAARGTNTIEGYDAQGRPVVFNNKTNALSTLGAEGPAPYSGPITSKAAFEKQADAAGETLASGDRAGKLIEMVKGNPRAFADSAALASMMPNFVASRLNTRNLSPEDRQVRTTVMREAAIELNKLYGAALSAGENQRAQSFIPDPTDNLDQVLVKLQAAQSWANSTAGGGNPGAAAMARSRQGGGAAGGWQDTGTPGVRIRQVQ